MGKLLFLATIVLLFSFSPTLADDFLAPSQSINDTQKIVSAGGIFALGFFTPGSSKYRYLGIKYNKIPEQTVVWVANRDTPVTDTSGILKFGNDGSLVLTNGTGAVLWSSGVSKNVSSGAVARIMDSGNFVVADGSGSEDYVWQSFEHPTDTILPDMKLGVNLRTGLNVSITSWKSEDNPAPGEYTMYMDVRGDPQLFFTQRSTRRWRTGPWMGRYWSAIPEMKSFGMFNFIFFSNRDEVSYVYHMKNSSVISRVMLNYSSATAERSVWAGQQAGGWNRFWIAPRDQCDVFGQCGSYGVCNANDQPIICKCMQGFEPRKPNEWSWRDGKDGCRRKTSVDCRNGTDGFVRIGNLKMPDTTEAKVDMGMGMDQCRAACLGNCSCTAYASANSDGTGCLMWFGDLVDCRTPIEAQDLFVRVAAADLVTEAAPERPHKLRRAGVVVAAAVCTVIGALLLCGFCYIFMKKRKRKRTADTVLGDYQDQTSAKVITAASEDLELPLFDLATVVAATDNFSELNKLGEGGFGPVYKGILNKGQDVAVKRLAKNSVQGIDEFKNEVLLIAKLQHRNLVRLLGCCIDGIERMLIYEYMSNKSLDAFLFDKTKVTTLEWQTRYRIILGIARGLLYLHQDSRLRIIHRDLKAGNVLLDDNMNPKISDFGMARIFGGDETEANTRRVVGTYGYMSPEYALDGIFSVKSDVFSFGVLVLEIVSGTKNRAVYLTDPHLNLLGHSWRLWNEGKSLELIDPSITGSFPVPEALRCIKLGLLCVQERPEDRPTMSSVVLMLGSDTASLPQPKQPGYVALGQPSKTTDSSSSKQGSCTVNDITVTVVEGR